MLSGAKHPHRTGFLACARNDKEKMLEMTKRNARNNIFAFVLLNEAHFPFCHAERSEASMLD